MGYTVYGIVREDGDKTKPLYEDGNLRTRVRGGVISFFLRRFVLKHFGASKTLDSWNIHQMLMF